MRNLMLILFVVMSTSLCCLAQVGHWRFNNDASDASGNSIDGTLKNGASFITDCKEGSHALGVNGTNQQFVDLGNSALLPSGNSSVSLSAWAKTIYSVGSHVIVAFGTPQVGQAISIGQQGSSLTGGGHGDLASATGLWDLNVWHHVCLTYDGTVLRLYFDGVEKQTATKSININLYRAHIGKNVNNASFWGGAIDDVRIFNRVLSAAEVTALANTAPQLPLAPSDLVANTISSSQIDLTWSDNSADETGFQIERSLTPESGYTLVHTSATNETWYSDTNLNANTTYYYRVRALNTSGESSYTQVANATTISSSTAGPVAHWRLNNDAIDASDNGRDGILMNGATFTTDKKEGTHALALSGTSQYVDLGSPAGLPSGRAPRSMCAWAKTNSISNGYRWIISYGKNSGGQAMFIGQYGSSLRVGGYVSSYDIAVNNTWTTGVWKHICLTYDGSVATVYVDGMPVASAERAWNLVLNSAFIGKQVNSASEYWNGSIDDVRIYDRVLSASEVSAMASVLPEAPVAPSGLTGVAQTDNQIELTWIDNASDESGFQVERSLSPESGYNLIYTAGVDETAYIDTGLSANTSYYYRVRAISPFGSSSYSESISVVTLTESGPGPVAHWKLNNNALDAAGNRNGTLVNGPVFNTDRTEGSHSLSLNGVNQHVNLGSPAGLPSGTASRSLSAWAKTNTVANGYRWIISYGKNANGQAMFIGQYGSSLRAGGYGSSFDLNVNNVWTTGVWKHICLTYDGEVAKVYVDGEEVASGARTWNLVLASAYIGRQVNNQAEYWNGNIDDVRIYDRALAPAEVQALAANRPTIPMAPSNVQAANAGSFNIELTWLDNATNETGYEIERSISPSGGFALIGTVGPDNTSYSDMALSGATTYYYRIRAISESGASAYSEIVNATTDQEPVPAPTELTAEVLSSTTIHLAWLDNSPNETGFQIERSTTETSGYVLIHTTPANITSYDDTGLIPETNYYYRVRATSSDYNSSFKGTANARTYGTAYEREYIALRDFYKDLGGENWTSQSWWSQNYPPNASYPTFAAWKTGGGNIQFMSGDNKGLNGIIPSTFWDLPLLTVVRLQNNKITGLSSEYNESVAYLYSLYELDLSHNEIPEIPENIADIYGLQYLDLSYNKITDLPAFISRPPALHELNLGNNEISQLPDFEMNNTLFYLVLSGNQITTIPLSILKLYNLRGLNLANNKLMEIPEFLADLGVNDLNLSSNYLRTLPEYFYINGVRLDVSNNYLDFSVLERLKSEDVTFFVYAPQRLIDDITEVNASLNSLLEIPSRDPGEYSAIQWERLEGASWVSVNHLNEDATLRTFRISRAAPNHQGTYRWKMTNSLVTGLTLESVPIEVRVIDQMADALGNFAFQYRYDARKRMTHKKVPGAEWVYMVYDNRDRLVMTQDGNQRNHVDEQGNPSPQWTWTKYDELNRPILTGIYTHDQPLTQQEMSGMISTSVFFETRTDNAPNHGYTNNVFSTGNFIQGNFDVLTATYYDDDSYKTLIKHGSGATDIRFNYASSEIPGQYTFGNTANSFQRLKGLITATKVKVVGAAIPAYLWSVNHFDDKGRIVQNVSTNALGYVDRVTNVYDFLGKVLLTRTVHNEGDVNQRIVQRRFEYDHAGRLMKTWHSIDDLGFVLISMNEYNELGQLVAKKLHNTDPDGTADSQREFKQNVDYRYNIRGWLTSVNDQAARQASDLFGMNLKYNDPSIVGINAQYNGNISQIDWKGPDVETQRYGYRYDAMNRLVEARYYNSNIAKNDRYNEVIWDVVNNKSGYDLNGNIRALQRNGKTGSNASGIMTYGTMDNLIYAYKGNQLLSVTDSGNPMEGFKEGSNSHEDYAYDANGNMQVDRNKGIDEVTTATGGSMITYNYRNLPEIVRKNTGEYIRYIYDATGRKLRQEVYDASDQKVKNSIYAGEFFYEGESQPELKFINTEEGRIVTTDSSPEYQYHLKDHLGNVRLTFTSREETETARATYENSNAQSEEEKFLRTEHARKVYSHFLDRTNGSSPGYAQRLSGGLNERYGLARSIAVMPGDKITAEVYAKYVDGTSTNPDFTTLLSAIAGQINGTNPSGPVVDGGSFNTSTSTFPFANQGSQVTSDDSGTSGPRAYLNWLVFDGDFNLIPGKSGYVRVPADAKETGSDIAHRQLTSPEIAIEKAGYVYIYLSNEEDTQVEVYFDDFEVEHTKSPVVQMDDYYPFGLSFNSYSRENSVPNLYQYNGKEKQDELDLGWMDYGRRMYMPEIGRWGVTDSYADIYESVSPYSYVENNPIVAVDPDGRLVVYVNGFRPGAYFKWFFNPINSDSKWGVPPPHEWNSPNWYSEDQFDYWTDFQKDWKFEMNAEANYFVDGSNYHNSTGETRGSKGIKEGKQLADKIKSGEITLQDGEFIKLVGHSMGAAHAAGIAQGLVDGGVDPSLIKLFLFAPHQPNQIRPIEGVSIFQFGRDGDKVSSNGILSIMTWSKHTRIPGADWVVLPDRPEEAHGGHYIRVFTTEEVRTQNPGLYQYLIDSGYINPDGSLDE